MSEEGLMEYNEVWGLCAPPSYTNTGRTAACTAGRCSCVMQPFPSLVGYNVSVSKVFSQAATAAWTKAYLMTTTCGVVWKGSDRVTSW